MTHRMQLTSIMLITAVGLSTLQSCKIRLLAEYDAKIVERVDETSMHIDHLYFSMLEIDEGQRTYKTFTEEYVDILTELNGILHLNEVKELNKGATGNAKICLDQWVKYKDKHKADNTISDADIKLNQVYMQDYLQRLQISQKATEKDQE